MGVPRSVFVSRTHNRSGSADDERETLFKVGSKNSAHTKEEKRIYPSKERERERVSLLTAFHRIPMRWRSRERGIEGKERRSQNSRYT